MVEEYLAPGDDVLEGRVVLKAAQRRLAGEISVGSQPAAGVLEHRIGAQAREVIAVLAPLDDGVGPAADQIVERVVDHSRAPVGEGPGQPASEPGPVVGLPNQRKPGIRGDGAGAEGDAQRLLGVRKLGLRGSFLHAGGLLCLPVPQPSKHSKSHPHSRPPCYSLRAFPEQRE